MADQSRTTNSIKNMSFGLGGQLLNLIVSFVGRTVFIIILGADYLGINGLFSNILAMLSLAELGVGSAITCCLYKPLAEKDEKKINALIHFFAVSYRKIGCTVATVGLMLAPFLEDIIKDKPDIPYLRLIYILFLANSVVSYFYAHKSAIISADQKQYIVAIYRNGFNLAISFAQILLLLATHNYLFYLIVQVVANVLANSLIARQANRMYPYLKNEKKESLDQETKSTIYKNIKAMVLHQLGTFAIFGTDNILISMFVGVYWVGLYSNYIMIIGIIDNFISSVFSAVTASVGHLNATETAEKAYSVFKTAYFLNFWLSGFCSIALWVLFNPFITLWIGPQYVLDPAIVFVIVINFFITGMRKTVISYKFTLGLFWPDRYKPLFESVINIIASVILLKEIGFAGVLWGTLISTVTTCLWVEPYVLYKYGFHKPVRIHFAKYGLYMSVTLAAALSTEWACSVFSGFTLVSVVGRAVCCVLIPNVFFALVFFRTREFQHVLGIAKGMAMNVRRGIYRTEAVRR